MAYVVRALSTAEVISYLERNGVASERFVEEVLSGFGIDPTAPAASARRVLEIRLEEHDELFQALRNPSADSGWRPGLKGKLWRPYFPDKNLGVRRGNWYSLSGATPDQVGIFGGLSGRTPHKFRVHSDCSALEGDAAPFPIDWASALGGSGGATQIFVPPLFAGHIDSLGAS